MLEELLQLVAEGGAHSYEDLAEHLSISQPMLEAMLENLARLDYLRSVDGGCREQCTACHASGCAVAGPGRLWTLTDKGARSAVQLATRAP
jgi:hypothetical protein